MVFVCTTPRRGGLRFGRTKYFRAEQAVPRGRSRRFKAVNGGGAPDTLGAPAVAKRTKPINSVHPKPNKTMQILEAMWHALCFTHSFLPDFFMDRTPLEAGVFTWF